MSLIHNIQSSVIKSLSSLYGQEFTGSDFQINQTKPEFEGDYTVVLFSLLKKTGKAPQALGEELGNHLVAEFPGIFEKYNIIKGFLNLSVPDSYWLELLNTNYENISFGQQPLNGKKVMVEYSSPNTNKPLHLGHLRNNFLGWSVAEILKAQGFEVLKSSIVNDRGIHICKSMIAWEKWGNGETPESSGKKGDHLVGDFYVMFENELKRQAAELKQKEEAGDVSHYDEAQQHKLIELQQLRNKLLEDKGYSAIAEKLAQLDPDAKQQRDELEKQKEYKTIKEKIVKIDADMMETRRGATPIMAEVKQMLLDWEAGKPEVIDLWKMMNGWVYKGMDVTYKLIGSDFDKTYYESNTYLLGKDIVQEGLDKGIFFRKPDSSVWIDLTADGLDEKLVLRKDGTSVYITQDIGLAKQKYDEYNINKSIYVIGNEQNYHMKVLKLICQKLGLSYADDIHHLSYGMVELPTGKMKSREGTVVDADDVVAEMEKEAQAKTEELGKVKDFTAEELAELYHVIGLGALKFFLLRVDPKNTIEFDPSKTIDFVGFTAPFIQYNYARIKSVLRKNELQKNIHLPLDFLPLEKELIASIEKYPVIIRQASEELNPSAIALYVYDIAKTFSSFFAEHSIANAESAEKRELRLRISTMTANVIKSGMHLLGIDVPERM